MCLQVSVTASLHLIVSDGTSGVNVRVVNFASSPRKSGVNSKPSKQGNRTERCLVDRHSERATPGDLFGFISRHFDFLPHISVVYFDDSFVEHCNQCVLFVFGGFHHFSFIFLFFF